MESSLADTSEVIKAGTQMLLAMFLGWICAHVNGVDQAAVRIMNEFALRVSLPCLQFWLLGIKTNLQNLENWRCLAAVMLWAGLIFLACALWVLLYEGRNPAKLSLHLMVLSVNNTGIIAPVLLQAALGPEMAVVGMLATVVLYLPQLPLSMLLMELHQHQAAPTLKDSLPSSRTPAAAVPSTRLIAWSLLKNPCIWATALAVLSSLVGSPSILDPARPSSLLWLHPVEGTLAWFARCTVPLTLFTTGLWMHGRNSPSRSTAKQVVVYKTLRLVVAPVIMVMAARICGVEGRMGMALLLLTAVPVGQTAFVVSEQYGVGTEVVTSVGILGIFTMLPHALLLLDVGKRWQLF